MGAVVLDSSVVIGFFDAQDAHHAGAAAEIRAVRLRDDDFVLPATVLAESLVGIRRDGPAATEVRRRDLVAFFGDVRPVDEEVAVISSELRHRHRSLRLPDALVVATAIVEDGVMLTCDRLLGTVDPRVQVVGG